MNKQLLLTIISLTCCCRLFSSEIVLTPGGGDDAPLIQTALDTLQTGDTLRLLGDFSMAGTLYLPSDFTWILDGSLSLSDNAELDEAGWVDPPVDAARRTGITEKPGGASNIHMSGGSYYGNAANYGKSMRFINFVRVSNSRFNDMHISDATDDNFTLGPGCNNNICRNLIGSFAGGNGLTDKGDFNKWYDCIAEDCESDGWTPKCRNSEFHRCIGRRNAGPGFGCFARLDGSGNPVDLGETITGNKFFACEAYENERGGFSFNIASTSGQGSVIRDNYIQGIFYNNQMQGLSFRNKQEDGIIENNQVDILVYGNRGLKNDGTLSSYAGGLGVEGEVTGISGSIVAFENGGFDVNIRKATGCTIKIYQPSQRDPSAVNNGEVTNMVTEIPFTCSQVPDKWCTQAYCELPFLSVRTPGIPEYQNMSQIYPNPFGEFTQIHYSIPASVHVTLKVYDSSGREVCTLIQEKQSAGKHSVEFDGSCLSGGSYFYRFSAGDHMEFMKFIQIN